MEHDAGAQAGGGHFDCRAFVERYASTTVTKYQPGEVIYAQGDLADSVYFIVDGRVKITVLSEQGKERIIAFLGPSDFFGEGCLDGGRPRRSTVMATSHSTIGRVTAKIVRQALAEDISFSNAFFRFLLDRNEKLKEDLIDQLFSSSEKRLARILLTLANVEATIDHPRTIDLPITQETLANMVGTTRSRINQFMTKFRKLGHIEYGDRITVHNSLLNIILNHQEHDETR